MRVAVIDYKHEYHFLEYKHLTEDLEEAGFSIDVASDLDELISCFMNVECYDGLLAHPGINDQNEFIKRMQTEYPRSKYAIILKGPESLPNNKPVPAFSIIDIKGIVDYFKS